jgi:hypothetical protein
MTTPQITLCPPQPPRPDSSFDKYQFGNRYSQPVEAKFIGYGNSQTGWSSATGLSFDDYKSCSTQKRKTIDYERRLSTPAFMQSPQRFRAVIIRYLEMRAGLRYSLPGTEMERMQKLTPLLKRRAEMAESRIDKFCALYVDARNREDAEACKSFERYIHQFEAECRIAREPYLIPAACKLYWFSGWKSTDIAVELGLKSDNLRQIFLRLRALDAKMQGEWNIQVRQRLSQAEYYHNYRHVKQGKVSSKCRFCTAEVPL